MSAVRGLIRRRAACRGAQRAAYSWASSPDAGRIRRVTAAWRGSRAGKRRQSAADGQRDRHRGQVEHEAGADGGGAGRECCAGHAADADVSLAGGEAEAGPSRTSTYPAAAPRRPAPRAGSRRVALTIG